MASNLDGTVRLFAARANKDLFQPNLYVFYSNHGREVFQCLKAQLDDPLDELPNGHPLKFFVADRSLLVLVHGLPLPTMVQSWFGVRVLNS